MLAPGTVFYNIIKGDGTSYAKHKAWQDICDEFCYQSGRPTVKLQKLREMYKKEEEDQQVEIQYALGEVQVRMIGQTERDNMLRQFMP